jgi:hypothetical protein
LLFIAQGTGRLTNIPFIIIKGFKSRDIGHGDPDREKVTGNRLFEGHNARQIGLLYATFGYALLVCGHVGTWTSINQGRGVGFVVFVIHRCALLLNSVYSCWTQKWAYLRVYGFQGIQFGNFQRCAIVPLPATSSFAGLQVADEIVLNDLVANEDITYNEHGLFFKTIK